MYSLFRVLFPEDLYERWIYCEGIVKEELKKVTFWHWFDILFIPVVWKIDAWGHQNVCLKLRGTSLVALAIRYKNTETCKNLQLTSRQSELPKSCTTSTFHMVYFSWIPQNIARWKLNQNVIFIEMSHWWLHIVSWEKHGKPIVGFVWKNTPLRHSQLDLLRVSEVWLMGI